MFRRKVPFRWTNLCEFCSFCKIMVATIQQFKISQIFIILMWRTFFGSFTPIIVSKMFSKWPLSISITKFITQAENEQQTPGRAQFSVFWGPESGLGLVSLYHTRNTQLGAISSSCQQPHRQTPHCDHWCDSQSGDRPNFTTLLNDGNLNRSFLDL